MFPAARVGDNHSCPMSEYIKPHIGGPIRPPGAPRVLISGQPAARVADLAVCVGPTDIITGGAASVLCHGLPIARVTVDPTAHQGRIVPPGASTVLVGGSAFAVPANFALEGPADFQNKLVRDLYYLSTLPSGKVLLDRLAASGKTITFTPTSDGNEEVSGPLIGVRVHYNPDRIMQMQDPAGNWESRPPVVGLAHEMIHALGDVEGTSESGTDPAPPASEPNIAREEARTIGTGSYAGTTPTENSIRQEMGLPQRVNHYGRAPPAGTPLPPNPRPGD